MGRPSITVDPDQPGGRLILHYTITILLNFSRLNSQPRLAIMGMDLYHLSERLRCIGAAVVVRLAWTAVVTA